jgi:hypothetical protein
MMRGTRLTSLTDVSFSVRRDGAEPAEGVTLLADADGHLYAARDPSGELTLRVVEDTASVDDLLDLVFEEGLEFEVTRRRLLVALVAEDQTVRGVMSPDAVAALMVQTPTSVRIDSELFGPAEGPVGESAVRCPHCSHVGRYGDVEPGETRCDRCGGILRPV